MYVHVYMYECIDVHVCGSVSIHSMYMLYMYTTCTRLYVQYMYSTCTCACLIHVHVYMYVCTYTRVHIPVLEIVFESVQQKHLDKTIFDQQIVDFSRK